MTEVEQVRAAIARNDQEIQESMARMEKSGGKASPAICAPDGAS